MTIEKAELKQLVYQNLQGKVGERVEGLRVELLRAEGAARALEDVATSYPQFISARLKSAVESKELDDDQAAVVSRYIRESSFWLGKISTSLRERIPVLQGRVQEASRVTELLDKEREAERVKEEALKQEAVAPVATSGRRAPKRIAGARPKPSLKAQRSTVKRRARNA